MKPNLGKIFLFLLLPFLLNAAHRWEVELSKTDLVVGEATLLSYTCYFEGEAYGTSIDIEIPKQHDDYTIEVYKARENIIDDNRRNHFQYVIFPKHSGKIDIRLKAELRKTSREQVENAVIGRDNVEYYQFEKAEDTLPLASLHVKPTTTELVGDFSLHVDIDKEKLSAYEPLHVSIVFEGTGNLNNYKPFDLDIKNSDIFREKPKKNYHLTPEGYRGSITQKFAIVSENNFTLPKFSLEVYNPKLGEKKHLSFQEKFLHVSPAFVKKELLDPLQDDEKSLFDLAWIYYFLTFISGIILGWYAHLYLLERSVVQEKKDFMQAKDAKTLLTHLALQGGHEKLIEKAENEHWSLKKIQKNIKL